MARIFNFVLKIALVFMIKFKCQVVGAISGPEQPELVEVRNSLLNLDLAIKNHARITKELSMFSDIVQKAIEGRKIGLSEASKASHLPPAEPFFWLRRQSEIDELLERNVDAATQVELASEAYQKSISKFLHSSYHVKSNSDTGCYQDEEECTRQATEDAGKAVLRLQDTYALTADEMARLGPRNSAFENFTLTISDCFELGRTAYNSLIYPRCVQWINLTLGLLPNVGDRSSLSFNESELYDYISFCYYKIEDFDHAIYTAGKVLELNPYNMRVKQNLAFFISEQARAEEEDDEQTETEDGEGESGDGEEGSTENETEAETETGEDEEESMPENLQEDYMHRYRRLCRLMLEENPHDLDQLIDPLPPSHPYPSIIPTSPLWRLVSPHDQQCVYLSESISAWERLRGVALEVLSTTPPLVIFHNFLSDVDTEETKASAEKTGRLARSTVHDPATGKLIHAEYRTSEGTFIYDKHLHPNIVELERRISLLSGLSLVAADDLQIAHYAPGGHYEPHVDMANQPNVIKENVGGNRIATFLIYLNDVSAGGATAFLEAKPSFVVRPKRGAALFWYNLGGPFGILHNLNETQNGIAQEYEKILRYNEEKAKDKDYFQKPTVHGDNGIWETRHAACPVHSGVKWVANKWIREYPDNSHRYHYL